ncbi:hypothetical protein Tco_0425295 [Tanacetum coccineum]
MGKRRVSSGDNGKDREDSWKNIFKSLFDMIQKQQRQIESFVKERKSLEKRIKFQHERWAFDVKLLQDHISQMKRDMKVKDMIRFVDTAKANMIISMKQKEAKINKRKFVDVDDERADLKILFEEVTKALAEPKQRVTRSNRKESLDSALKAERDFAWNQFEKKDNELQEVVRKNKKEVGAANDKVVILMSALEKSEFSNIEKDKTISTLQEDLSVLESESRKKSEEISRLNKELEFLRGGGSRSITPVLQRCMVTSSKNNHSSDITITKQERGSKRKAADTTILFNSTLKVPKLKN